MADKLKTFVDTTWTLSDVDTTTNKLTLIDNGANTQAVVKDIQVNMSKAIKGTINIGNYAISNELVTLTGSAIIDNNESMVFEIPVPFGIKLSRSVPKTVYSQTHYATSATNIPVKFINVVQTPTHSHHTLPLHSTHSHSFSKNTPIYQPLHTTQSIPIPQTHLSHSHSSPTIPQFP